jgi:spermidine synthase
VRLTAYYLCISGGGALGGLFVGIVAPQIFSGYYELPFGWAACWVLFTWVCLRDPGSLLRRRGVRTALVVAVAGIVVTLGMLTARESRPDTEPLLYQKRNFFGILRVTELRDQDSIPRMHRLMSGTTIHGAQSLHPKTRFQAITYYGSSTGIGFVMARREPAPMHVGIIGLGVGTLAAYGRAGDRYQFYEIDPDVIRIAENEDYFSYLANSPAQLELIPGDGRLSLENQLHEEGPHSFDLLVLDAFSSDSIPVHLLTAEAVELYTQHLKPDGVLAVHVTNRHLSLTPLVFRLAAEFAMRAVVISNQRFPRYFQQSANWLILSKNASYLDSLLFGVQEAAFERDPRVPDVTFAYPKEESVIDAPLWTDDYSDLFSVLRSRELSSDGGVAKTHD